MSKKKTIAASLAAVTLAMLTVSHAFAQVAPSQNGIGAQIQSMAQEGSTTSGYVGSFAMYAGALVCFLGGVWALWQSRQPQNRENGRLAMGLAGLVLCGLFAGGGAWINKASNTTGGANAAVTSTAGIVTFGGQ
jgi:drug/metabolite transporter (DMT)-like permease